MTKRLKRKRRFSKVINMSVNDKINGYGNSFIKIYDTMDSFNSDKNLLQSHYTALELGKEELPEDVVGYLNGTPVVVGYFAKFKDRDAPTENIEIIGLEKYLDLCFENFDFISDDISDISDISYDEIENAVNKIGEN